MSSSSLISETGQPPAETTKPSEHLPRRTARPGRGRRPSLAPLLWQGKIGPAFWTIGSLLSIALNLVLVTILILVGRQLFALKTIMQNGLVGGLYHNFVLMDQAHITTTIQVQDTIQVEDRIPVVFDLPLHQNTVVTLVEDTPMQNVTVYLNNSPVYTDLVLRQGTPLHISLDLTVPVSQTVPILLKVPISLQVPVDIPLNQTQLHAPFVGLQNVVVPYRELLKGIPDSWSETPACGSPIRWACRLFGFR